MGDELQVATFLFVGLIIIPAIVGAVIAFMVFLDETKQEIMMVRRHPNRAHEEGILTEKPLRKAC
jgi:hypothetical protein